MANFQNIVSKYIHVWNKYLYVNKSTNQGINAACMWPFSKSNLII